jgi:hypothetical protein
VHTPTEYESDDSNYNFFMREHVFSHFPVYHMNILFGAFRAKEGREGIYLFLTKYYWGYQIGGWTWVGHVTCVGRVRNTYQILVRKPEGKRPLGRSVHRWEDNIKVDHRELVCEGVTFIADINCLK